MCSLLMTVAESGAGIVSDEVEFRLLAAVEYEDILGDAGGALAFAAIISKF